MKPPFERGLSPRNPRGEVRKGGVPPSEEKELVDKLGI